MPRLFPYDDFEAQITLRSIEQGGRRSPVFNGIRWDIAYDDLPGELWMVWPEFMTVDGQSWPRDRVLPVGVPLAARMLVVRDELRASFHRQRIRVGVQFGFYDGPHRQADAVVTRITGLNTPRPTERSPASGS